MSQSSSNGNSSSSSHLFVPRNVIESVIQNVDSLISATSVTAVLEHRRQIAKLLHLENESGIKNFFRLKAVLFTVKSLSKWNRVAAILKALDQKANQKEYSIRNKLADKKILVIGGGISGLRAAIECLLIGAQVVCVEKRDEFSRNNVIHLWPNVINDMYTFEAKRLYGQFCVGSIDHIAIRQLQIILLKIAVLYGVKFVPNIAFEEICPRIIEPNGAKCLPESCTCCCHSHGFGGGAYAHFKSPHLPTLAKELTREAFDVIIGCDGMRNTFSRYFPRNNRRGKLAIGLTANYVNRRTEEEAHCPEISGISRIYNQKWFKDLQEETGIELENLVYYRDETHYFVMTATKASLLRRGVLRSDYGDSHALLSNSNIDISMLMKYSKDAAEWSSKLKRLEFALNSSHKPDVALFDFTSMYSATNASCAKRIHLKCCGTHGSSGGASTKYTLLLLSGDSLLEPFWPTGSGAGRGFLSALDAAWTVSLWYSNIHDETVADIDSMLNVICRREYVYRLLAQTSPENTNPKNFSYDPSTRYKNLNLRDSLKLTEIKNQVRHLIINKSDLDMKNYVSSYESKRSRRATVGINPEDVLKAKQISYKPLSAFNDELNEILPSYSNKSVYCVPSSSSNASKNATLNCDNVPFEVIERKPKNSDSMHNSMQSNDFRPRNYDANLKKNYQARNHFFTNSNLDDIPVTEVNNSNSSWSTAQEMNKEKVTDRLYDYGFSQSQKASAVPSGGRKGNAHRPTVDTSRTTEEPVSEPGSSRTSRSSSKPYSWASRAAFLRDFAEQNSRQDKRQLGVGRNQNTKKSSDIIEKAQYLEQKFEESKKAYVPKLSKVGKIEDEDWNVKMWNSADVFAPKAIEKRQLVHDNSKVLLQSRISQLNNNFQNSHKEDVIGKSKGKVTSEYVNMLSNEVTSKFSGNSKGRPEPVVSAVESSIEVVKAADDSMDGAFKHTSNLKTVGECRRCSKIVTVMDRVCVLGQNYHRTCLTCKACSIMLRQDEVASDDFLCKVCLKSRTGSASYGNARNSFFDNQMSTSLIEAKKNFLINIEQIDLRERAEFEIMDEAGEGRTLDGQVNEETEALADAIELLSSALSDEALYPSSSRASSRSPKPVAQLKQNQPLLHRGTKGDDDSSQSDLSESPNYSSSHSDTNYTDDEHSESDDQVEGGEKDDFDLLMKGEPIGHKAKDEEGIQEGPEEDEEVVEVCPNGDCTHLDNDFACATDSLLMPSVPFEETNASTASPFACTNADLSSEPSHGEDTSEPVPPVAETNHDWVVPDRLMVRSLGDFDEPVDRGLFAFGSSKYDHPLHHASHLSYPNSDSSLVLDQQPNRNSIDRAFGLKANCDDDSKLAVKEARVGKMYESKPSGLTYSGQFTEKFYRTLSQPTLYEQLDHIDRKLKKSAVLPPVSHEDMPFADSHEDLLPVDKERNSHAPVTSLEDV